MPSFTNLVSAKARPGFDPRLPDSESGVLTVTPPDQMPLSGLLGWEAQRPLAAVKETGEEPSGIACQLALLS